MVQLFLFFVASLYRCRSDTALTREEEKAERQPQKVDAVVRRGVGRVVNPTDALRGQWRNGDDGKRGLAE